MISVAWAVFKASPIARWLAKIGGLVLLVLTFGAYQRRQGAQTAKAKQAQQRMETMEKANEVRSAIDAKSDAAVRGDLGKWVRPE